MPIIRYFEPAAQTELYIWKITEELSYFLDKLSLLEKELNSLHSMLPKRQLEWILPRYICYVVWGHDASDYKKDQYQKPFLSNQPWHISISHSSDMFAIMRSSTNCGIDIQLRNPRISSIKHKFTSTSELEKFTDLPTEQALHSIWCSKEAVYKCYGRRQLSLTNHIKLKSYVEEGQILASITKDTKSYNYQVTVKQMSNYTLAYALEQS